MPTLVCAPIMVQGLATALEDAACAKQGGADLVEYRLDEAFHGEGDDEGERLALRLCADSPLPCVITCRPVWEGGAYDGDDMARISLFEKLGASEHPPRYIDVELAAYTRSANLRQKVNLAVGYPSPRRDLHTSLILSIHDFEGRPADLTRRLAQAWGEPGAAVVKVAFRARSIRDNLELFEILRDAPKPTIALGMGQFGVMSRALAPKFGGFLTYAGVHARNTTAPGQPTLDELFNTYRFRSITAQTKVYGVIGWPVAHSHSPRVHNAAFAHASHDGVLIPMPVASHDDDPEAGRTSLKATLGALFDAPVDFAGAAVTLPHKEHLAALADRGVFGLEAATIVRAAGAANTLALRDVKTPLVTNTDAGAIESLLRGAWAGDVKDRRIAVWGAGGVARAAAFVLASGGAHVHVVNRSPDRAVRLAEDITGALADCQGAGIVAPANTEDMERLQPDAYINCTPVGMVGGPAPDAQSIPVDRVWGRPGATIFFDTVYNPIETPMLIAAREPNYRVIDGASMFARQAAAQHALWTGSEPPLSLFDTLSREADHA